MSSTAQKARKGCLFGCGGILGLLVLGMVALTFFGHGPTRQASRSLDQILESHGEPAEFVPGRDGAIETERLEVFMEVRGRLIHRCQTFREIYERVDRWVDLDTAMNSEDATLLTLGSLQGFLMFGPELMEFNRDRNLALLEVDMSLGEYIYIYATVYYGWLEMISVSGEVGSGVWETTRESLAAMLGRVEISSAEGDSIGPTRAALDSQVGALLTGDQHYPWEFGLPARLVASLEPHRSRLEELFCPHTDPYELVLVSARRYGLVQTLR